MTERDLFIAALQLEPNERPHFFERECPANPELRLRVRRTAFGPRTGR